MEEVGWSMMGREYLGKKEKTGETAGINISWPKYRSVFIFEF